MLSFRDYQEGAFETAKYPNRYNNYIYPVLGLTGEAGEVAEKVKKVLRDNNGIMTPDKIREISKELGDVLWYIAAMCTELGLDMEGVAFENLQKLASRKQRDALNGSGDNR